MTGLLIDNFAGGGGASYGLMEAFGRKVDIAINHDAKALAMHEANHPETLHLQEDVFAVDPYEVCAGRPIDAAWFSPDCTHFSRAKGGKPVKKNIRGLAWVVMRWISMPAWQRPQLVIIENVEEFQYWCPLLENGRPDPARRAETFQRWLRGFTRRNYVYEYKMIHADVLGAGTIRKRFFLIARCDGLPIVWPDPTHYNPKKGRPPAARVKLKPRIVAADSIDFSLPCPSIFGRKKPLAENTLRRIGRGMDRFVINNPNPFVVPGYRITDIGFHGGAVDDLSFITPLTHQGDARVHGIDEPLRTITTAHRGEQAIVMPFATRVTQSSNGRPVDVNQPIPTITTAKGGEIALIAPSLIQTSYGERPGQAPRILDLQEPLGTVVAGGGKHALVASFLAQYNNNPDGSVNAGHPVDQPMSPITTKGPHQALVTGHLLSLKGTERRASGLDDPTPAITAGGFHVAEVRAFLLKYYGTGAFASDLQEPLHTSTAMARFGLVMVHSQLWQIVDIGMRMLTPRELFNAQGFPRTYQIQVPWGPKRKPLTKSDQIRLVGNSVCPPVAIAIAKANAPLMSRLQTPAEAAVA